MTESEREDIQGRSLLRLHKAKSRLMAHRIKLARMADQLKTAGNVVAQLDRVQPYIVNDRKILRIHNSGEEAAYPSMEELSTAFDQFREAVREEEGALKECQDLGVGSF